jgi:vacuolar-type H+-ATPase subunit E/Vma4
MSDQQSEAGGEEIIQKILGDGEARAGHILDNAKRTADAEKRKAEAEAGKVRKEILDKAMRKAAALKSKEIAGAHIEAKRVLLRAREQAISRVFETIREALIKVHEDTPRYRKALVGLAVEAVRAIEDAQVTVVLGKDDEALTESDLVQEINGRLASEGLDGVSVEISIDPAVSGGGCLARSKDSRVIFDNTFARRLERLKPSLRSTIVSEVLKSDG